MSNFFTSGVHEKESSHSFTVAQKPREGYVSPYREGKQEYRQEIPKCPTSPSRFTKNESARGNDTLPPRAVPFRRSSRNSSREHIEQTCENSVQSSRRGGEADLRRESVAKVKSLERRAQQEAVEKEKWRSLSSWQQQQIKKMAEDLARARDERQTLNNESLRLKEALLASEKNLLKANESIQSLNKSLKECRISQKSLANLKNLQNQLDVLQQRNAKLTEENDYLSKNHRTIDRQLKQKDSTSESETDSKKDELIKSLELQIKRLKEELQKGRSERELLLESNLRELERKLYDKQNEIKKISIQLNFIDRKKYISIDEVKTKKDQEIKDLRQRFMKVSKDLKETKDKIELNEKRKTPKERTPVTRRVKSSKLLGTTSESEEVTFELSSEI